jgi:hypothetical protein
MCTSLLFKNIYKETHRINFVCLKKASKKEKEKKEHLGNLKSNSSSRLEFIHLLELSNDLIHYK